MKKRAPVRLLVAAAVSAAFLVTAPGASAAEATVQLRVEGLTSTIFEGSVTTDGRDVEIDGVDRTCDGTNNGANPSPGPTMITALDDISQTGAFTWDGTWFDSFEDVLVDRIGPDSGVSFVFWGLYLNFAPTAAGGCQTQVSADDEALFAYNALAKLHALELTAPAVATAGVPFQVTVTDGANGDPIAGALVGNTVTGPDGTATMTFDAPGFQTLKADRADSVRSNSELVCVQSAGGSEC